MNIRLTKAMSSSSAFETMNLSSIDIKADHHLTLSNIILITWWNAPEAFLKPNGICANLYRPWRNVKLDLFLSFFPISLSNSHWLRQRCMASSIYQAVSNICPFMVSGTSPVINLCQSFYFQHNSVRIRSFLGLIQLAQPILQLLVQKILLEHLGAFIALKDADLGSNAVRRRVYLCCSGVHLLF